MAITNILWYIFTLSVRICLLSAGALYASFFSEVYLNGTSEFAHNLAISGGAVRRDEAIAGVPCEGWKIAQ